MINRDRIYIEDLRVEGIIGIFDWEKETKQEISISYEIDQDNLTAANTDKIEAALITNRSIKQLSLLLKIINLS